MKEVTMITTVEITAVEVLDDESAAYVEYNKDSHDFLCDTIKQELCVDDAIVLKNQLFIRDLPTAEK